MKTALEAWEQVPPQLRANCLHLGITTIWPGTMWAEAMVAAVDSEVDRRLHGGLVPVEELGGLRVALLEQIEALGPDTIDGIATLASSVAFTSYQGWGTIDQILGGLLREMAPLVKVLDASLSWGTPAPELADNLQELLAAKIEPELQDEFEPAPTSPPVGARLMRRLNGRRR